MTVGESMIDKRNAPELPRRPEDRSGSSKECIYCDLMINRLCFRGSHVCSTGRRSCRAWLDMGHAWDCTGANISRDVTYLAGEDNIDKNRNRAAQHGSVKW